MGIEMKDRLDVLLVKKNFAESREKAKAIIMSGNVFVNGVREDKAGSTFDEETSIITIKGNTLKYVSRGGLKLEKAVDQYGVELEGKICMDVGSSTGGFTDCMLQNGATKVYAVDVGTNQLAWKLRQDERVVCMEKTNIRYVLPEQIEDIIDFISIDVAFISLTKVLTPVYNLLKENGQVICLIKPQFEAGREKVGKKGVVRDKKVHVEVVEKIIKYAISLGFRILDLDYSPIKGPEGNIEYLLYLKKSVADLTKDEQSKNMIDTTNMTDMEDAITDESNEGETTSMSHTDYYNLDINDCIPYVDNQNLIDLKNSVKLIVDHAHETLK